MTRGVYLLVFHVSRRSRIRVGALGEIIFDPGQWVYVGSAMGSGSTSIENRIGRHASSSKRIHWHIDYLLPRPGRLSTVVWAASESRFEHAVSLAMQSSPHFLPGPARFGCSDCRPSDRTHLFRSKEPDSTVPRIMQILSTLGLVVHVSECPSGTKLRLK